MSFHPPTEDTCDKCDAFKASLLSVVGDEKECVLEEQRAHHAKVDLAYREKRNDKEFAKNNAGVVTASFDLQKVLPCPFLQTGVVYYKRQLAVYNLTIYETRMGTSDTGHCLMWDETIAGRGSQEIGSCLWKWLETLPEDTTDIRLYSDSCGGQNRNYPLTAMLMHLSHSKGISITHSYLEPGHTHMEADTIHSIIEKQKKDTNARIEVPRDWITTVRAVHRRKRLNVIEMNSNDFKESKLLFSNGPLVNRPKNTDGEPVGWLKIRRILYSKDAQPGTCEYVTSFEEAAVTKQMDMRKKATRKSSDWDLPQQATSKRRISAKKLKDLKDLLPFISEASRSFYDSLKADDDADEDEFY